jgi:hypothetical protein
MIYLPLINGSLWLRFWFVACVAWLVVAAGLPSFINARCRWLAAVGVRDAGSRFSDG